MITENPEKCGETETYGTRNKTENYGMRNKFENPNAPSSISYNEGWTT